MQETLDPAAGDADGLTERQRRLVQRAAELADDFATRAAEHDRDGSYPAENFAFNIPKETPGVLVKDDWNTLGMRATGSVSVEFKDCYVTEMFKMQELEFGAGLASSPFAAAFLCWFEPSVSSVYLGVARSAY